MERLSGLDASFLYIESLTQPLHVCSILELDTSTMEIKRRTQAERSAATVEADVMRRLAEAVAASSPATPAAALRCAVDNWLVIARDPEVRQLVLLDAPNVLGWEGFRDVAQRYSLGLTEQLLTKAMRAGQLRHQPVRAFAHILIGALDEAAMVIATAEEPGTAHEEVSEVLHRLLDAILIEGETTS